MSTPENEPLPGRETIPAEDTTHPEAQPQTYTTAEGVEPTEDGGDDDKDKDAG